MRRALILALAAVAAFGCKRERARDTGREVGEAAGEVREGAERAAGEVREFGEGVKEGATGTPKQTLTSAQKAELEAGAASAGYQIVYEEDGAITAIKVEPTKQPVGGQEMSDEVVESAVKAKLHGEPGSEAIQVHAHTGVVTLSGPFDSFGAQSKAIALTLEHPGVQQVVLEFTP